MSDAFVSSASRILAHASAVPERQAVVCDGDALSYRNLVSRSRRCVARLQALGIEAGSAQRVALIAGNSLDFVVVLVAGQLAGITVAPISGLITADAQARMIDDANAVVLFHDAEHADKACAAAAMTRNPAALHVVGMDPSMFDRWLADAPSEVTPVSIQPEWLSDLIYSSGTTGIPKGITQSCRTRSSQNVSLGALGVADGSKVVQTVGLYSNYGMSSLLLTLWWGATFFTARRFSGADLVTLLASTSIDMIWFAPATLLRTLEAPGFAAAVRNRHCIKLCMGAPLSAAHKERVRAAWPGKFIEGYGQTETGTLSLLFVDDAPNSKLGSVGTVIPTGSVRIIDDEGNALPAGKEGEIAGHTTTMMSGYHGRADANAATYWYDESGRRYVRTGDIGRLDADGYLWLCDRKKDMIISGGYNIFPADIERVLQGHPAVFEAAVVGCASARWGETPVAFVTLCADTTASEPELREWVNSRLGKAQRVAVVRILDSLPDGAMGKILKRELRDRFTRAMGTLP